MAIYRAQFLDHADDIYYVDSFEAEHDDAAIAYAREVYTSRIGKGYEIWQDDRLVHSVMY